MNNQIILTKEKLDKLLDLTDNLLDYIEDWQAMRFDGNYYRVYYERDQEHMSDLANELLSNLEALQPKEDKNGTNN